MHQALRNFSPASRYTIQFKAEFPQTNRCDRLTQVSTKGVVSQTGWFSLCDGGQKMSS